VRFLYLNRTCFNGIYRVNLRVNSTSRLALKTLLHILRGICKESQLPSSCINPHCDFEETIDEAAAGDFVFVDPPYTVMHNNNNFVKYNANLFSWADQRRLVSAVKRAARRGAAVMISNADHQSVRELYSDFGTHHRVNRASVLAADFLHRRKTTELLITSYQLRHSEYLDRPTLQAPSPLC